MISQCQMSKKMSDQVVNKELDLNWCQPKYDLLKLLRRIFFFLSVILKLFDSISRLSLSAEPPPHERIGTGPLHLEQSGTHLHSGDSLPILAAIWGTTFLPKVWFLMSTVFVRKKKYAELPGLRSKCQLEKTEKKRWNCVSSFTFTTSGEKMTVITNTRCLQKVLIAALWDDVNPVFDHRPWAFFQIVLRYKTKKKTNTDVGGRKKKKLLRYSDYRLLQPNEQTFVLSTPPLRTASSWLRSHLQSRPALRFYVKH